MVRVATLLCLLCGWCAAQAAPESGELERRLRLADQQRLQGRLAAAESTLAAVQGEIERTEGPGFLLAMAFKEHGLLRDDEGRPEQAIPLYEQALAMVRAQPGATPVMVGLLLADIAGARADAGDAAQALAVSTEAMNLLQGAVERMSPSFAVALYAHGVALHSLGRNVEALRDLRESLDIRKHAAEPGYGQWALTSEAMAGCFSDLGYSSQAEASAREALSLRMKFLEPDSLGIAASLNNLGVILARNRRLSEGRQALEQSAAMLEKFGEREERRLAEVLQNLGGIYYMQAANSPQLWAKAEEVYRRKLGIEERILGPSDVHIAATLEMLGEVLFRERAYNEAGQTYRRGLAIQQAVFGFADPHTQAAAKRYSALAKKMTADAPR